MKFVRSWWRAWRFGEKPPARLVRTLCDGTTLSVVTWGNTTLWVLVGADGGRVELSYNEADQLYWFLAAHLGVLPPTVQQ